MKEKWLWTKNRIIMIAMLAVCVVITVCELDVSAIWYIWLSLMVRGAVGSYEDEKIPFSHMMDMIIFTLIVLLVIASHYPHWHTVLTLGYFLYNGLGRISNTCKDSWLVGSPFSAIAGGLLFAGATIYWILHISPFMK